MNPRTFVFHNDPGHAWLEVPMGMIIRFGLEEKISSCSYRNGETAYLEEDCDAPLFLRTLESAGVPYKIKEAYEENTPIRGYGRYTSALRLTPETVMELLNGRVA